MPETTPCTPCGSVPQTVNVPGTDGADGADGAAGADGTNAYTIVSVAKNVPAAVGSNVLLDVENTGWMVVGQPIFVQGPSNYVVVSIPNSTQVQLQWKGFEDDVSAGTVIPKLAGVSPGGTQAVTTNTRLTAYAGGDKYALTVTPALLGFGGAKPQLTLNEAGTWLIFARARLDYFNATYAAAKYPEETPIVTLKLHETQNTNLDLDDSSTSFELRDVTTAYFTAQALCLPPVTHITAATDDVIELWGSVDTLPTNSPDGTVDVVEAEIVALKISESTTP
jgi:hypothetical protein